MDTKSPQFALRLYNAHRKENSALIFSISRSCDEKEISYYAHREGDALVGKFVSCKAVVSGEWKTQTDLPPFYLDAFYGLTVQPVSGKKTYEGRITAFPDRPVLLALKPNRTPGASDGHVVARCTFELAPGISVPNVQLFKIYMEMTFNALDIPDVTRVFLFGFASLEEVARHLTKEQLAIHTQPLGEKEVYLTESIPVSAELKKRFDTAGLTKKFLESFLPGSGSTAPKK